MRNVVSSLAFLFFLMATEHLKCMQAKEVSKSNFLQEGQMEKQRWEESEKRKGQKKDDAGARKGRKVAKHGVWTMICGLGGSKSRLAPRHSHQRHSLYHTTRHSMTLHDTTRP